MTKVYTRSGDSGTTSLIGGERVFKTDSRVEAYGTVDELSAFVAQLADHLRATGECIGHLEELDRILSRLMTVEALLAIGEGGHDKVPPLPSATVTWLEERIDTMQAALPDIDKFTLPGGHPVVSLCHVCRTVCRRAERAALRADQEHGIESGALVWLNRLSDYFYLLGRSLGAHFRVGERLWIP